MESSGSAKVLNTGINFLMDLFMELIDGVSGHEAAVHLEQVMDILTSA